jgi:hypothetical protein
VGGLTKKVGGGRGVELQKNATSLEERGILDDHALGSGRVIGEQSLQGFIEEVFGPSFSIGGAIRDSSRLRGGEDDEQLPGCKGSPLMEL